MGMIASDFFTKYDRIEMVEAPWLEGIADMLEALFSRFCVGK